jgi:hypothetical protein
MPGTDKLMLRRNKPLPRREHLVVEKKIVGEEIIPADAATGEVVVEGGIEVEMEFKMLPHNADELLNGTDARLQKLAMNNLADEFDDSQQTSTVDQAAMKRGQQSNEFYTAEQLLIDKYETLSGGMKYDRSPDSEPLPSSV